MIVWEKVPCWWLEIEARCFRKNIKGIHQEWYRDNELVWC